MEREKELEGRETDDDVDKKEWHQYEWYKLWKWYAFANRRNFFMPLVMLFGCFSYNVRIERSWRALHVTPETPYIKASQEERSQCAIPLLATAFG